MKKIIWILILGMWLSGCATLEEGGWLTPQPVKSKYFETTTAGFGMDTGEPDLNVRYFLSLKVIRELPDGAFLEFYFENPQDKHNPIIVTKTVTSNEREIHIESPKIQGLKSYEGYVVVVKIYDNEQKNTLLGEHRQVIRSIMDQQKLMRIMEEKNKK